MHEADERHRPRRQGDEDEPARQEQEEGGAGNGGQPECADRVHAQREDRSPIKRVVLEREPFVDMPPEPEDQEHRNPPGGRGPEEHRESEEKRLKPLEERRQSRVGEEQGAGQRGNGHRSHVDPVRRHQIRRREAEERVAIEDQRYEPDVEHSAGEPEGEADEQQNVRPLRRRRQERCERGDRFRGHHGHQPTSVDALIERRFGLLHGKRGEDAVDQHQPENERGDPEREGEAVTLKEDEDLRAEHAGRRNGGEKSHAALVIDQIGKDLARKENDANDGDDPEDDEGQDVDDEQSLCDGRHSQEFGRDRHDPCCHDQGKVGRVESADALCPFAAHRRSIR